MMGALDDGAIAADASASLGAGAGGLIGDAIGIDGGVRRGDGETDVVAVPAGGVAPRTCDDGALFEGGEVDGRIVALGAPVGGVAVIGAGDAVIGVGDAVIGAAVAVTGDAVIGAGDAVIGAAVAVIGDAVIGAAVIGVAVIGVAVDGAAVIGAAVAVAGATVIGIGGGVAVDGFAVDGFAVDGFAVDGFAVDDFAVVDVAVDGCAAVGFAVAVPAVGVAVGLDSAVLPNGAVARIIVPAAGVAVDAALLARDNDSAFGDEPGRVNSFDSSVDGSTITGTDDVERDPAPFGGIETIGFFTGLASVVVGAGVFADFVAVRFLSFADVDACAASVDTVVVRAVAGGGGGLAATLPIAGVRS